METLKNILRKIKELFEQNSEFMYDEYGIMNNVLKTEGLENEIKSIIKKHIDDSGWIQCSERMPKDPGKYEKGYIIQKRDVKEPFSVYWNGETFSDDDNRIIRDVIAWRPLPEPYKPTVKPEENTENPE